MLRAANPDDAKALATILGQWFDDTPYLPRLHTPAEDRAFVAQLIAGQDVLVHGAEAPDGFVARNGSEISQLYLAPEARSKGIGSALLDAMKDRADHLTLWCFQENTGARRFYARHEFVELERTDGARNEEKVPDVHLEWRRTP